MSVISGTIGALTGSKASSDAAAAQAAASKYAADIQKEIYMMQRMDMAPFLESAEKMLPYVEAEMERAHRLGGQYESAILQYEDMFRTGPGKFEESDYYKDMVGTIDYAIGKAVKEMGTAATASGAGYGRDLMDWAVPMAAEATKGARGNYVSEWINTKLNPMQTYMAQLGGVSLPANPAMNVIPSLNAAGSNYATGAGNAALYGGEAQASGILGQQNALMQGIGGLSSAAGLGLGMLTGNLAPATKTVTKTIM